MTLPGSPNGLSPLARGNRLASTRLDARMGSIPARTGEPGTCEYSPAYAAVYPRSHGGTAPTVRTARGCQGLSPLARGNLGERMNITHKTGSIPARTGEPRAMREMLVELGVYPRSHGGTVGGARFEVEIRGLSPLARGNRRDAEQARSTGGSIPARTGEPAPSTHARTRIGVYPRSHGGTELRGTPLGRLKGLSPLARGNQCTRRHNVA